MNGLLNLTHVEALDLAAGYVLGALDADEAAAVRDHLASCPESHELFAELGAVVPALAETVEMVEPPARLRGRILAAAAADLELRGRSAVDPAPSRGVAPEAIPQTLAASPPRPSPVAPPDPSPVAPPLPPALTPIPFPTETERAARRRTSPLTWAMRIAAVAAIVVLAGWNVVLRGQVDAGQRYQAGVAAVLDVATRPGSETAVLGAAGGDGPRGLAAVAADGSVTMAIRDLSPTEGSQVYEAWVIVGSRAPVPIGGFTVGADGTATFRAASTPARSGAILALTREPRPGPTTPTLPIVSKGVATAPAG